MAVVMTRYRYDFRQPSQSAALTAILSAQAPRFSHEVSGVHTLRNRVLGWQYTRTGYILFI